MAEVATRRSGEIAYGEATPEGDSNLAPALCLHGFPETSYMWRHVLAALAEAGRRAVAPDLSGFGDSPPDPPGTWERHVDAVERFRQGVSLERAVLILHDWGGLIGLRWALDHMDAVAGLILSNTGFFSDGRWHGMARALRTPGEGEQVVENMNREGFAQMLGAISRGMDEQAAGEYWKTFETKDGRQGVLDLYRSGDFAKLVPYEGKLGDLGVPTLLLWGENDVFAPLAGAHRFQREIPGAKLVVVAGAGHFVYADEPNRCAEEIVAFLDESGI